jgi:hypothetical protein
MRRDELMNPDRFSEILLILMGGVIAFFLIFTAVFAVLRH